MGISNKVATRLRGILRDSDDDVRSGTQTLVDDGPAGTLGPYQLEEVIGAGGMGTVYRAVDRTTGKQVALKVPHAGAFPFSGRFERESELAHTLGEVGDAPYLAHGVTSSGTPFLAMPLLDGETLDNLLSTDERIAPGEALRIAERVAHVLGGVHQRGLVHRDVKPGNVLIDAKRNVWLVDHGLMGSPKTIPGAGTPAYAAPEQLAGRPVTPAADVYALGVMLLEMWLGEPVHVNAMGRMKALGPSPVAKKLARCDDADVARLLAAMLSDEPGARPRDGALTARALARIRNRGTYASSALAWRERGLLGRSSLVGRERELAELSRVVDVAREAHVTGPVGIGKSRLLAAWCRRHAPPHATILWPESPLAPHPRRRLETARSWLETAAGLCGAEHAATRHEAVRELVAAVASRTVGRAIESARPEQVAEGIATVLGALAEAGGLVVVTDHPVDAESMALLRELQRRHGSQVIALHESLTTVEASVTLSPLTDDDVARMADEADGAPDVGRAVKKARGNPLAFQAFAVAPGNTIAEAVAHRIRDLDPYARWLLRLASLCGRTFDARTIVRVAGHCDGPSVRDGLERLDQSRLLIDLTRELGAATGTYRFTHAAVARAARSVWPASSVVLGTKLFDGG